MRIARERLREKQGTRRGSGESHLVSGERKEVFEDCKREIAREAGNQERIR